MNNEQPYTGRFGLSKPIFKQLGTTVNQPARTQKTGEGNLVWVRVPPPALHKTAAFAAVSSLSELPSFRLQSPRLELVSLIRWRRVGYLAKNSDTALAENGSEK